jgi:hypothetical protein
LVVSKVLSVMKALMIGVSSATRSPQSLRVLLVDHQTDPVAERARRFGVGLLRQQHAAHVGVHDDRVGRLVLRLGAGQRAHLVAVLRVGQ